MSSYSAAMFTTDIRPLNVAGVMSAAGIGSWTELMEYDVLSLIELMVLETAVKLNGIIKQRFERDMMDIGEYIVFPRYMTVMSMALSREHHMRVDWRGGSAQANFIDTDSLGSLLDLADIQREVFPDAGSLAGWEGMYTDWVKGKNNRYEDTVKARLNLMESRGIAPFWDLVEHGNTRFAAYPKNGPKLTLFSFRPRYIKEMRLTFQRVVNTLRVWGV